MEQPLHIQSFTYEDRQGLLSSLPVAFTNCGGWVLERKTLSPTRMSFQIEIQLRAILNLYVAVLTQGVEPTSAGHKVFTELCTRRKHQKTLTDLGQIVALRLEISFLDDTTLHSLLAGTASHA